jgi:hypothetical protein
MLILGLSSLLKSGTTAALVRDGAIDSALENYKLQPNVPRGIPEAAIQYCLSKGGVAWRDIDVVAIAGDPFRGWERRIFSRRCQSPVATSCQEGKELSRFAREWTDIRLLRQRVQDTHKVVSLDHHSCHAASAFFLSPFDKALILTLDGEGDGKAGLLAVGEYLDFVLQFAPPAPEEKEIRARLARIGIGPGKTFNFKDLSLEHKAAVLLGMKEGDAKVDDAIKNLGKIINGWNVAAIFGDQAFYNGDWLKRAAAAKWGIFGNSAEEALYPFVDKESTGETLDCSKHNYTLTFAANLLPPVKAFWSLTMYDPKTQHLIQNPINRYLLNSEMLPRMKKNPDGSLTLLIQKNSPGKEKEANWLPAPDGPIYMLLRLYVPNQTPPSILPVGEGTWQPPAVMKAQ